MTPDDPTVQHLIGSLRSALDSSTPLYFLDHATTLLWLVDGGWGRSWSRKPRGGNGPEHDPDDLIDVLLSKPSPETDCLLVACAEILGDPSFQATIDKEVKPRLQVMPAWLAALSRIRVKRALVVTDVLGAEEYIILESTGPRGGLAVMVNINMLDGPFVEDPRPIDDNVDDVDELIHKLTHAPLQDWVARPLELKEARARLESAVHASTPRTPPAQTETWPAFRPLLQWQLRTMPEGGEGYASQRLSAEDLRAHLNDFTASRYAFGYMDWEEALVDMLGSYAYTHGTGDPRQWSARLAKRALTDLAPRKRHYSPEQMRALPRVLGAMVMYGHEQLGVSDFATQEVLDQIEAHLPTYFRNIAPTVEENEPSWYKNHLMDTDSVDVGTLLVDAVGGEDALENLNTNPLPAGEPLKCEGVPEDVLERVEAIGDLVGTHAAQHFLDPEMATASYRTLHLLATEKPEVFRRRSKDLNTAAVILYIAGHNNRWFDRTDPDRTVLALAKAMGVKAISWDRAFNATKGLHTE